MYDALVDSINAYIKANANNEITGPGLNTILIDMLNALGAGMRFYGLAIPSTSPVVNQYPKFYLAFLPGTYGSFRISNPPVFTSGFAVLYDSLGDNTWRMSVKSFDINNNQFVINASVRDSTFGTNTAFYVKGVEKTSQLSSFTIYALDKDTSNEQLVASFTYNQGALAGYKTHKIESNSATFTVSVNWDVIPTGERTEFSYDDTKFPATAYVDSAADEDIVALKERVELAEYICGGYAIDNDGLFRRKLMLGADAYIGDVPDFRQPTTQAQAETRPWSCTNKRLFIPMYNDTASRRTVDLLWANFPVNNIYYVYLLNNRGSNYTISVRTMDTDGTTVLNTRDYTLETNSIMEIQIIRLLDLNNKLVYKVDNFLY